MYTVYQEETSKKNNYTLHIFLDPFLVLCKHTRNFTQQSRRQYHQPAGNFHPKLPATCICQKSSSKWRGTDLLKTDHFVGWHPFLIHPNDTLPPIIMEMENGPLGDKPVIFEDPIFHFHDYGRKGKPSGFLSSRAGV